MSVLIKDMEMPTSCADCRVRLAVGCCGNLPYNTRMPGCPLGFVPPHGRLIDADALDKAIEEEVHECAWDNASFSGYRVWNLLDDAPTIIPAEEGEK